MKIILDSTPWHGGIGNASISTFSRSFFEETAEKRMLQNCRDFLEVYKPIFGKHFLFDF
jgi:hypothetical protein